MYADDKFSEWTASVLLSGCVVVERPTKKSGFCFKIHHPLGHPIYLARGPQGEQLPGNWSTLFVRASECVLRAGTEADGRQWLAVLQKASHEKMESSATVSVAATASVAPGKDDGESDDAEDDDDTLPAQPGPNAASALSVSATGSVAAPSDGSASVESVVEPLPAGATVYEVQPDPVSEETEAV